MPAEGGLPGFAAADHQLGATRAGRLIMGQKSLLCPSHVLGMSVPSPSDVNSFYHGVGRIPMADAVVVVPTPARMSPMAYTTTLRAICHQGVFSLSDMMM